MNYLLVIKTLNIVKYKFIISIINIYVVFQYFINIKRFNKLYNTE